MKKLYALVLVALCGVSLNLNAAIGDDLLVVKFELTKDITKDKTEGTLPSPLPTFTIDGTYSYGAEGGTLIVETRNLTTVDNVRNFCFENDYYNASTDAPWHYGLAFSGAYTDVNHSNNTYSYITIRNTGNQKITKIEAKGVSADNSVDFPIDGSSSINPTSDADYESINEGFFLGGLVGGGLHFAKQASPNDPCPAIINDVNSFRVQDEWDEWVDMFELSVGELKTIRIRFSNKVGGPNPGSGQYTSSHPILQALYVYVEDDGTATGVGEIEADFDIRIMGDVLEASQPCDVTIYTINGIQVESAKEVTVLPVSNLQQGIYLVKAQSANGQSKTIKMVR